MSLMPCMCECCESHRSWAVEQRRENELLRECGIELALEIAAFTGKPEGAISPEWESCLIGDHKRRWTRMIDEKRLRVDVTLTGVVAIEIDENPGKPRVWCHEFSWSLGIRDAMRAAEDEAKSRGWIPS